MTDSAATTAVEAALERRGAEPTPEERTRERVVLAVGIAEMAVFGVLLAAALMSSSLTLLSVLLRLAIMLVIQFVTIFALLAVHRHRFGHFGYGIGKLEQSSNLLGCTGLVVGGLWIATKVLEVLAEGGHAVAPSDLALAAVVNGASTLVSTLGLLAMKRASRPDESAIYRGQYNARKAKFVAAWAAQVTITIAAVAQDPAVAAGMDALGAALMAWAMISVGLRLGASCVHNLLDHAAPAPLQARIAEALAAAGMADAEGLRLRTRRSGRFLQVEATLPLMAGETLADYHRRAAALEAALASRLGDETDVSVVLPPP